MGTAAPNEVDASGDGAGGFVSIGCGHGQPHPAHRRRKKGADVFHVETLARAAGITCAQMHAKITSNDPTFDLEGLPDRKFIRPETIQRLAAASELPVETVASAVAPGRGRRGRERAITSDVPKPREYEVRVYQYAWTPSTGNGIDHADERAAVRKRFGIWLRNAVETRGFTQDDLIERFGAYAEQWWTGRKLPLTSRFIELSEWLGEPLAVVCAQAGRPPEEAVRIRYSIDPHGSLMGKLAAWREEHGYTGREAAELCGMNRHEWSRIAAGSKLPSPRNVLHLARGTGWTPAEIVAAASMSPNSSDAWAQETLRECSGFKALIDAWCIENCNTREGLAETMGVPLVAVAGLAQKNTASLPVLTAFAHATRVPLDDVLRVARFDAGVDVVALARAAATACRITDPTPFATLVYRARHAKGYTQNQVAKALGVDRSTLPKTERYGTVPALPTLVRLTEVLEMDLAHVLAAAGQVPIAA